MISVTAYPMSFSTAAMPADAVASPQVPLAAAGTSSAAALQEAWRQQAAALLQHAYRWLETTVPAAPQLSSLVAPTVTAVQLYQAQQYAASLRQVNAVIGAMQQARWAYPNLPPL